VSSEELEHFAGALRRLERVFYRALEDAAEFGVEEIFATLERDERITRAALFLLIFGQLENRLNKLAERRIADPTGRSALRDQRFERRLEMALRDLPNRDLEREILGWYGLRNLAAHGRYLASSYNIGAVLSRAQQLEELLARG
jgi:hypothetical protein